jgi:hypothetical protein
MSASVSRTYRNQGKAPVTPALIRAPPVSQTRISVQRNPNRSATRSNRSRNGPGGSGRVGHASRMNAGESTRTIAPMAANPIGCAQDPSASSGHCRRKRSCPSVKTAATGSTSPIDCRTPSTMYRPRPIGRTAASRGRSARSAAKNPQRTNPWASRNGSRIRASSTKTVSPRPRPERMTKGHPT